MPVSPRGHKGRPWVDMGHLKFYLSRLYVRAHFHVNEMAKFAKYSPFLFRAYFLAVIVNSDDKYGIILLSRVCSC